MSRPIVVTVGPLASAVANNISTSQRAASAQALVLNGALSDVAATAVCASQSPGGAGALTINGTMVNSASGSAVAYFAQPRRVYVTSAGNDSGRTFTITGTLVVISGPPVAVTETVTGANTSTVSTTKLFSSVTSVTISGASAAGVTVGMNGVATLDTGRRVLFTSAGDDSAISFTVTGTNIDGSTISETLAGVNASTAYTVLDYKTVTSITTSAAIASTLTVGTNGVASSPWVYFDAYSSMAQVAIQLTASGTVNYTLQQTLDNPNRTTNTTQPNTYQVTPAGVTWVSSSDSNAVGATGTIQTNYGAAPVFARILLNSGSGTVTGTFTQAFSGR